MKTLFVSLTDYQLINYINIKKHMLTAKAADIIIVNNKAGNDKLAERLRSLDIFENVYLYTENLPGLHKFARGISEGQKEVGFMEAVANDARNLAHRLKSKLSDEIYAVNCRMENGKQVDFSAYDQVVGIDTKAIVKSCRKIARKFVPDCRISSVDEGLASYLNGGMKEDVDDIYLYEPELAVYHDRKAEKIIRMPKIDKNDAEFTSLLNRVFAFNPQDMISLENKVVFFDQNWDPLPKYLREMNWWKKIIFHNPYKKHLKESVFYDAKMNLFKAISEIAGDRLVVKLHPRSDLSFVEDYKKYPCEMMPNITAPWELFGLNCNMKNCTWTTLDSGAICSYYLTISDSESKCKMIVGINFHKALLEEELFQFFEKLERNFPELLYLPANEEELSDALASH